MLCGLIEHIIALNIINHITYNDIHFEENVSHRSGFQSLDVTEEYLFQFVDHFDVMNNETWEQQYFVDEKHWKGPGYSVFLLLGGEWNAKTFAFQDSWCSEYAREFNALCLYLEHRYYGESQPQESYKFGVGVDNWKHFTGGPVRYLAE